VAVAVVVRRRRLQQRVGQRRQGNEGWVGRRKAYYS